MQIQKTGHVVQQPLNLTDHFPDYTRWLFTIHLTPLLEFEIVLGIILTGILALVIYLWLKYNGIKGQAGKPYIFLEVKPTDRTIKSSHATNQLFTTLHSLIKQELSEKRSISFELVSTKEEGIRFILRVPSEDISIVKKTLIAYIPGIQINEVSDYISHILISDKENQTVVQEVNLKNCYALPLQPQTALNLYDPIGNLTAHMTKLSKDELVAVQFISNPISENINSYTSYLKSKLSDNEDITDDLKYGSWFNFRKYLNWCFDSSLKISLFSILLVPSLVYWLISHDKNTSMFPKYIFEKKKTKRLNELSSTKQELFKTVFDKIDQPLFEVTIRIITSTNEKVTANQRVKGIISSFYTLSTSTQALKQKGQLFSVFLNTFIYNLNHFKKLHQFELIYRLNIFGQSPVLSVSELSSLYHFPNINSTNTEDLLQVKSPQLSPPLSLKQSQREELDTIFAQNRYGETEVPIGQILEERRRHTYIIGASGSGKSTLMLQMLYQDILNGKGLAVFDPHGDLINYIIGIIPPERWKDVVWVDPSAPGNLITLNILELKPGLTDRSLELEKDRIAANVIFIFKKLSGERYWGPRLESILRNALLTALETENPTIKTVYNLLTNKKFRKPVVDALPDSMIKKFWKDEFDKLSNNDQLEHVTPITNKLNRFLTSKITYDIVSDPKSSIDVEDIMNNNKILLVDLSIGKIGDDISFFLGSLFISKIHLTALRRINIPEEERVDFFLYIDEFQNFATHYFKDVLSGARKYRLDVILAHQNIIQIDPEVFETITGNSGTIISFRLTNPSDENKILPIFASVVEPGQLQNLPTLAFYIKIHGLQPQDAFTGETERLTVKPSDKTREEIKKLSMEKYAVKILGKETKQNDANNTKNIDDKPKNRNRFDRKK